MVNQAEVLAILNDNERNEKYSIEEAVQIYKFLNSIANGVVIALIDKKKPTSE